MSSSMINLSYITGPVIAGLTAQLIGERKTMMCVGLFVILMALVLLVVTPKKIRLPQSEIAEWKE